MKNEPTQFYPKSPESETRLCDICEESFERIPGRMLFRTCDNCNCPECNNTMRRIDGMILCTDPDCGAVVEFSSELKKYVVVGHRQMKEAIQ
jgi:hypothetical protein